MAKASTKSPKNPYADRQVNVKNAEGEIALAVRLHEGDEGYIGDANGSTGNAATFKTTYAVNTGDGWVAVRDKEFQRTWTGVSRVDSKTLVA